MNRANIQEFITKNVSTLTGVGSKTKKLLKKKNIEKISDLLWSFPQGYTDRSNIQSLDKLEIGKITTIKVKVLKYNFPRIRNLPSKVICEDATGKIDIVFFNSREGYIRKILPLDAEVVVSGKINYFKKKYQITNPAYVVPIEKESYVNKIIPKYSLTEGLTEKIYRKLIEQVLKKITELDEWHNQETLNKIGNVSWAKSILHLHEKKENDVKVLMMISTDKAVAPTSTMGATKYVAEKLTIDGNLTGTTKCSCVRFGNVLGSRGSVIPAMVKGVRERGKIWISDERVTRFAMPIPDAATLVLDATELCNGGEIFVLKMKSFSLQQLVRVMKNMEFANSGFEIEEKGLIRAEKLHEDLITSDEIRRLWESDSHYIVAPPVGKWAPEDNMKKVEMDDYNSSGGIEFSDDELAKHIQECVVALGLD